MVPVNAWPKIFQDLALPGGDKATNSAETPIVGPGSNQEAKDVILRFYEAYNAGDLEAIGRLVSDDVVYHDMALYEEPFRGRQAVLDFMAKVRSRVPADLRFVVDDVTSGDAYKVGIMWHVEIGKGDSVTPFPFSRGCSFYTVNDAGQITQARDLVESPSKPGDTGLSVMGALAPLIRRLGPRADPANLKNLPLAAAAVWALYAGYWAFVMLSPDAPGEPAFSQPPEVLQEVVYESFNFFYLNIGLAQLGLTPVPSVPCPPVSEAIFNFVGAWGLMFLPVILTDPASQKVKSKTGWWGGIMFLTNLFFIPFLALRAAPEPEPAKLSAAPPQRPPYPSWTRVAAGVGLMVGLFSLGWAALARPEYGDLAARWEYFQTAAAGNRVFYAFLVDSLGYSVWQAVLLQHAPASQRFVPFFGLAAHLLTAPSTPRDNDV